MKRELQISPRAVSAWSRWPHPSRNSAGPHLFAQDVSMPAVVGEFTQDL